MWTLVSDRRTYPCLKFNARLFSFFETSGPKTTATGSEGLSYVLYCKIKIWCFSQGLQVGHEWNQFRFLACIS